MPGTQSKTPTKTAEDFFSLYPEEVFIRALHLRQALLANLPGIIEQVDLPARMVGYCYGQKYTELVCTIIPSKKGLKLGFAYGPGLPDPEKLLEGNGKLSRYIEIKSEQQINSQPIKDLLKAALRAYKQRA